MARIEASPEDVLGVYDRQAQAYDKHRARTLFEARWLARFVATLPKGAHVLDLGCGTGEPIARWLMAEGFAVTGVDFSQAMLDIALTRWPEGDWRQADMRKLDLGQRFEGIIGWGSFFHLTQDEQRACLPLLADHLAPGGSLMLTVGHVSGEVTGTVGDELVFHASLSTVDYVVALDACGLRLTGFLAEDPETQDHSVLTARKDKE